MVNVGGRRRRTGPGDGLGGSVAGAGLGRASEFCLFLSVMSVEGRTMLTSAVEKS